MIFIENFLEKELVIANSNMPFEEICSQMQVGKTSVFSEGDSQVRAGEFLLINNKVSHIYIVKPTDSLETISKKFGKQVDEILTKNNIKTIFIGQQLFI